MIFRTGRRRTVPEANPIGPRRSENPLFTPPTSAFGRYRRRIIASTIAAVAGVGLAVLTYGAWFAVEAVTISGVHQLDPASLERVAWQYLDRQRWLIIPNRTLWLLSTTDLANYLRTKIERRLSVEQVIVNKQFPHRLTVRVLERIPIFVWRSNDQQFTIDRQGIVIEQLPPSTSSGWPIIIDEQPEVVNIQTRVIDGTVVEALQDLDRLMVAANFDVANYLIPIPTCPPPAAIPSTNVNGITNTNLNANASPVVNNDQRLDLLSNGPATNTPSQPQTTPDCDLPGLHFRSLELHAQLRDGPRLLFDRQQDLDQAVAIAQRVLLDPANRQANYIDIRFGERVYVR
ncbi:MAG: FtsQ-type POTRA domain-containing protein [Candidatus Kerfeldbacteria bacterium]|nr:FtsQ-type POTRA domain-containing protein [Candidatus Kerfeldbacteria bacterium]